MAFAPTHSEKFWRHMAYEAKRLGHSALYVTPSVAVSIGRKAINIATAGGQPFRAGDYTLATYYGMPVKVIHA